MSVGTEGSGLNPRTYSRAEYAALEAENARLVGQLEQARKGFPAMVEYVEEIAQLRAQLAAIQGGMGEEVEVVAWRHFGDASRLLCDLGKQRSVPGDYAAEFNIPLMTVAQHQRITAAMAAEVERWERNFRDIHEPALRDAHAYIQELRAELAEVKGREAACFVVGKLEKTAVIAPPLPVGTKLYALPPASPDVEGLVKALQRLLSWSDRQVCTHEETHRGGAIWEICDMCGAKWADDEGGKPEFKWPDEIEGARTALSTWRQAQENKP